MVGARRNDVTPVARPRLVPDGRALSVLALELSDQVEHAARGAPSLVGADLITTGSPIVAVELLLHHRIDLVVASLDASTALGFVREARQRGSAAPIVVVASDLDERVVDGAYESGVTFLLRAPITSRALEKIMQRPERQALTLAPPPCAGVASAPPLDDDDRPTWRPQRT